MIYHPDTKYNFQSSNVSLEVQIDIKMENNNKEIVGVHHLNYYTSNRFEVMSSMTDCNVTSIVNSVKKTFFVIFNLSFLRSKGDLECLSIEPHVLENVLQLWLFKTMVYC